ncbi:thiolase family protein [Pseudonocardia sp. WMMC193]|uniref:thiolase family protein n=1 Tax=Pseudonocardia sp. WMMC193 TaxID=2911965 RepID=UPI001F3166DD|nr:thiolase family protein [Pseudonocardia sp. WMMC193]MCF7550748.1 thiolase family protein [Pseudonocardia sp. WMMC193]
MPTPLATLAGFAEVAPGRLDRPFLDLHLESAVAALRDSGLGPDEVDGLLCVGSMMGESIEHTFLSEEIQDSLGLHNLGLQLGVQLGGGSHLAMLGVATRAIQSGQCSAVLCVSAGVFPPIRDVGRQLMTMTCHPDYELPYAPSIPTLYGLIAQAWLNEVGQTREVFAEAVAAQQEWAVAHPTAIGADAGAFSAADVLAARHIAGPFGYLDCSIPCEGGGAFLLVSPERAARLPHRPVHVVGIGEGHTHGFLTSMPDLSTTGATRSGAKAFAEAGITPAEVDLAQLYDAFSSNPVMLLEELGLAERGKAVELYREGATRPGGRLPVNTNGGLLRFGHAGTASGICGVLEAYQQMTGRAAGTQVQRADRAVVHAYGSMLCSHVTVVLEGS